MAAKPPQVSPKMLGWVALALSAGLMSYWLNRGWIPGDDGTLAQSALRAMHGQLPHRDFVENYTGLLDYYHALAFRLLGVNLTALRMAVFAVYLAWVPAVFAIAKRFSPPLAAGIITLLCAAWSLPAYPAAMPSWYNLFLATFGGLALINYHESSKKQWLVLAGMLGGVSFLVKITGLYYIAAGVLFVVYLEQKSAKDENTGGGDLAYRIFQIAGLAAFIAALCFVLLRGRATVFILTELVFPPAALAIALMLRGWRKTGAANAVRFKKLLSLLLPFAIGATVPVALFLLPYALSGSLSAFFNGVVFGAAVKTTALIRPQQANPHYQLFAYSAMLAVAIAAALYAAKWSRAVACAIAATAVLLFILTGHHDQLSLSVFYSAALILPAVVLYALLSAERENSAIEFLLLALAATGSLIRFPFPAPVYFNYCAPLILLAVCAVAMNRSQKQSWIPLTILALFFIAHGAFRMAPGFVYLGNFTPGLQVYPLLSERGANVLGMDTLVYDEVAHTVQEHAKGGPILAFPECPEVYFLSGVENLGRNDNWAYPEELDRALANSRLKVLVINQKPFFPSARTAQSTEQKVAAAFPRHVLIGKYMVYWRD